MPTKNFIVEYEHPKAGYGYRQEWQKKGPVQTKHGSYKASFEHFHEAMSFIRLNKLYYLVFIRYKGPWETPKGFVTDKWLPLYMRSYSNLNKTIKTEGLSDHLKSEISYLDFTIDLGCTRQWHIENIKSKIAFIENLLRQYKDQKPLETIMAEYSLTLEQALEMSKTTAKKY